MINPKEFIQKVKGFISENPKRAKFVGLLLITATLPLIIITALTVQNLIQKASEQNVVVGISDAGGNILSSTSDPNVFIDINLNAAAGWVLPNQPSSYNNDGLVKSAYAFGLGISCRTSSQCDPGLKCGNFDNFDEEGLGQCILSTSTPSPAPGSTYPTPQSFPTSIVTPTTIPISKDVYRQCVEDCLDFGGTSTSCQQSCAPISTPSPTPGYTNPTSTPQSFPTSIATPTTVPTILRAVYIENKDAESTGGNAPLKIVVKSGADIAHTPWRLNDLLPGQTQAPRIIQVTLIGDNLAVPFATTVNLVQPNSPTISTTITPGPNRILLKSNFFKDDETANSISKGTTYELKETKLHIEEGVNSLSFEYKILSALKQLGYGTNMLQTFQKKHNLEVGNFVDKKTMLLLDEDLAKREVIDVDLAKLYPPTEKFLEAPINEPSREHLAALFYSFLSILPDDISGKPWTVENFPYSYFVVGTYGYLIDPGKKFAYGYPETPNEQIVLSQMPIISTQKDPIVKRFMESGDYRYCQKAYYAEFSYFDKNNRWVGNCVNPSSIVLTTPTPDLNVMILLIHEYSHGVGYNIRIVGEDENLKASHEEFAKISFNNIFTLKRPLEEQGDEFVSIYARTNGLEDFAESFLAYILEGNIFRERAKSNIYLQQKYDFLKNKIFHGREYDTGNIEQFKLYISMPGVSVKDYNILAYTNVDPDFVWDYKYPPNGIPVSSTIGSSGDFNNDGAVNCKDIKILIGQYGQKGASLSADFNHDGVVDGIDYNMFVRNYTPGDTTVCTQ